MDIYIKQLKEDIETMKHFDRLYEDIDEKIEAGTATLHDEYVSDVYYKKSFTATEHAADMIKVMTGGRIDHKTARMMVVMQPEKIIELCERAM